MYSYTCLVLSSVILGLVHSENVEVNARDSSKDFSIVDDFDGPKSQNDHFLSGSSASLGVKRLWGIPDVQAFVGRIFIYPIPDDAFEGEVISYEMSELPSWLSFNSVASHLEGVPGLEDVGTHYITVAAVGKQKTKAFDFFSIQVTTIPAPTLLEEYQCSSVDDVTFMNLMINSQFSTFDPVYKVKLLKKISSQFMVKIDQISLTSSTNRIEKPKARKSFLWRHDLAENKNEHIHVFWSVGCNGKIDEKSQSQVKDVELSCRNHKLEKLIKLPVIGCLISEANIMTKRSKREAELQYSGDYAENEDYEYDYEDYFGVLNRVVPSPSTPAFGEEVVSTIHPQHTEEEPDNYVSPVFKSIPLSTPAYIPVKPTPIYVQTSPTVTFRSEAHTHDPESELASSISLQPTTFSYSTTPLTKSTHMTTEPTRAIEPIETTSVPERSETTEYVVRNFPPRIQNRIQKLAWIGGNVYRMKIPEDTFADIEDGNTRNLTLMLKDENGYIFPRDFWIQFDPSKQEVYGLPLEKDIGNYNFHLEALDKDHKLVRDIFTLSVRQNSQARNFHHQFTVLLKMEKKYEFDFLHSLDWQVKVVEKIAELFNDSLSNINVRNITASPIQITWTNVSLIDSSTTTCPRTELEKVLEVMLSGHGSEPSREAVKVFQPEFQLKKIKVNFFPPCDVNLHQPSHFGQTDSGFSSFIPVDESGNRGRATENSSPIARNQIDQLTAYAGQLYRYQVPLETCYDLEDGNSRNLKLRLLTTDFLSPSKDFWLQFDSANQEFFGLPLSEDLGRKEYLLECMDRGGKAVTDALIVEVIRNSSINSAHTPVHFGLTIDTDFTSFMSNAHMKAKLIDRIGQAFGDTNAVNIVVDFLRRGSIVVEWHNASLPANPCPKEEIQRLKDVMINDNGQLRKKFKKAFLPEFLVIDGEIIPSGSCLAGDTPKHTKKPVIDPLDEREVRFSDEDYLLTFIVPAAIIAVMLLLAATVACCVYKRRKYGKLRMTDDQTFVSKGIPIIFAEELDDHRPDTAKSPVIMKEEKPPLPPPEYQRNSPPPQNERLRHNSREGSLSDDIPYHPPPPFTSNGASRNQRPNLPPAYRKPPTYVPP